MEIGTSLMFSVLRSAVTITVSILPSSSAATAGRPADSNAHVVVGNKQPCFIHRMARPEHRFGAQK